MRKINRLSFWVGASTLLGIFAANAFAGLSISERRDLLVFLNHYSTDDTYNRANRLVEAISALRKKNEPASDQLEALMPQAREIDELERQVMGGSVDAEAAEREKQIARMRKDYEKGQRDLIAQFSNDFEGMLLEIAKRRKSEGKAAVEDILPPDYRTVTGKGKDVEGLPSKGAELLLEMDEWFKRGFPTAIDSEKAELKKARDTLRTAYRDLFAQGVPTDADLGHSRQLTQELLISPSRTLASDSMPLYQALSPAEAAAVLKTQGDAIKSGQKRFITDLNRYFLADGASVSMREKVALAQGLFKQMEMVEDAQKNSNNYDEFLRRFTDSIQRRHPDWPLAKIQGSISDLVVNGCPGSSYFVPK